MPDLPSGTVTFLFTDIEGSTALWERDRVAMATAVEHHLALLRAAIEAHDGALFKVVGDAVQAAFHTAPEAVAAALDAQRTLGQETWPEGIGPVRVRVALHTAAATPQDGDYLAPGLNRLSRLLAAGHGEQVLLSLATQDLARDSLPPGAGLHDLGEHPLRDLYRPERVFQLLHSDLPADFPPIRTLATRPNNLPLQPTPFLGREDQVARVVDLLCRDDVRLLTITGPGGVGKTRLALQAAADRLEDFPDGVWFVDLSSLTDPSLVPAAIATVLGVRGEGSDLMDRLTSVLSGQHLLLVLDNVERVIDATQSISDLLAKVPGLKVLATSRTRLHAYGEREYPLAPLPLPDPAHVPSIETLSQYEAVRLFIERAQAVKPDFAMTNANAPAIAEICSRLDGLPLAIELAAAFVKVLPPQALLKRLEKRLPLLTGGAQTLPARQQTMRDAIAWSHDLLSDQEQMLFRRLSVFAGGCTIDAAEAIINPEGALDVFAGIASLVDKSLLRQEEGAEGIPRFRMLETLREYGLERLEAAGEGDPIRRRHAAHFAALGQAAKGELWLGMVSTLDTFEQEIGNLRAAMAWAEETGDAETSLLVATTFAELVFQRGHLAEGREWLDRLLALDGVVPATVRAEANAALGWMALFQGDLDAAEGAAQQAIDLASTAPAVHATALNLLACVLWDRGLVAEARQRFEEALTMAHQSDADLLTQGVLSAILTNAGVLAQTEGKHQEARDAYEAALAALPVTEVSYSQSILLGNLAHLAWEEGDQQKSAKLIRDALHLGGSLLNASLIGSRLEIASLHVHAAGRSETVARLLGAAAALRLRAGVPVEPVDVEWYNELLINTRRQLGDVAFTQAWTEGEGWSLEQAVTQAEQVLAEIVERSGSSAAAPL
jgi:predicted ATPase/class 3 adenylate cyclase/Tfp pilus assembly protein PilF